VAARPLTAVIAAAGSGERLGAGGPKAFVEVAGRPLLAWSLTAFAASTATGAVIVAAPAGNEDEAAAIAAAAGLDDVEIVAGGGTRSQSVAAALALVSAEVVAIHDAARPLLTAELIDGLAALLAGRPEADAVIAAAPITDTVKRIGEATGDGNAVAVESTEDRNHLWGAQTPQLFRTEKLRAALTSGGPAPAATDEAMLIEVAGGIVLMQAPAGPNLKVTTAVDLRLAEALLRG
jgi:2-C-methyl-D-erythritol 4-phosphate cytidylyltransferase